MTTWTHKTVDYTKAEVGDLIVDEHSISYITGLHKRSPKRGEISPEIRVELTGYSHNFEFVDEPGAGYGFDAYEDGALHPKFKKSFEEVKANPKLRYLGLEKRSHSFNEPGSIRCHCGNEVWLGNIMTNTCDKCGRDYNISGQLLAPRYQWGEETGESLSDIL